MEIIEIQGFLCFILIFWICLQLMYNYLFNLDDYLKANQNNYAFYCFQGVYLDQSLPPTNYIFSYRQQNLSFTNCTIYLALT